jgi:hypothetical protein
MDWSRKLTSSVCVRQLNIVLWRAMRDRARESWIWNHYFQLSIEPSWRMLRMKELPSRLWNSRQHR